MLITAVAPSTMDGIKRLAKTIKRERGIPHHAALDEAARAAGFQNIRHAQNRLAGAATPTFPVYLTAHWVVRGSLRGRRSTSGRETLTVHLPKPLTDVVTRHWVPLTRNLSGFRLESQDHLELKVDADSQANARRAILLAVRTLQFMMATELRPASTIRERALMRAFQHLPGRDHPSKWIHRVSGDWVYLDEPYPAAIADRIPWAAKHQFHMISPRWDGLHNPGVCVPSLFCNQASMANQLAEQIARLASLPKPEWDGESADYFALFVSASRAASGKERRPRSMPAYHGAVYRGALPYGATRGGEVSSWRPATRMPLAMHLTLGPLVAALATSDLPSVAHRAVGRVRTTLDDWLQMEYNQHEMSGEQFAAAYYGNQPRPIAGTTEQLAALRRVIEGLQHGYAECAPRRQLLQRLAKAEAALLHRGAR